MKQYTSRELSEKLVKLGCKSHSGMFWVSVVMLGSNPPKPLWELRHRNQLVGDYFHEMPGFEFEDFCGTHEQARENRKLIWGAHLLTYTYQASDEIKIQISKKSFEHEAELMIRSNDWLKYLEKVMEERAA